MYHRSSIDAERRVLSAILNYKGVMGRCVDVIWPHHFHDYRHRTIYEACLLLVKDGTPIDFVTVRRKLKEHTRGATVAVDELVDILTVVSSPETVDVYCPILLACYVFEEISKFALANNYECPDNFVDVVWPLIKDNRWYSQ